MRRFLIAGNWKMNKTKAEASEFAKEFLNAKTSDNADVAVIVPFTQIDTLKNIFSDSKIKVGAQNCHYEEKGAYTGEISIPMLQEIGVDYCIIGHSERREYFNETDASINKKLKALLQTDIKPILCVGESLQIRESGGEQTFVASQIIEDLEGIMPEALKNLVIAYEPIWAIGTGKTATPDQAEEMCAFIRGVIGGMYSNELADEMQILYGGSMKADNAGELLAKPDIDGGLVGGDSLKPETFAKIAVSC